MRRWISFTFALLAIPVLTTPATHAQAPRRPNVVSPEVMPDHRVAFRLFAPESKTVTLSSGDLSPILKSSSTPMKRDDRGVWEVTVRPIPPGLYDYTFQVDGLSITDPSSPDVFGNRRGSRGLLEVRGPKGRPRLDEWRDVPHGTVAIHWYASPGNGALRRVHIYTPPGYVQDALGRYPVLYLLHGSGDNDSHWMHIGRANVIADNLIADRKAVPMVIVMPDGHARERPPGPSTEQSRLEQRRAFEKDLVEGVMPLLESTYRVESEAGRRAVAGLSMGSFQALGVGLGHPDRFAWIGAFSGAIPVGDPVLKPFQGHPERANDRLRLLWLGIGKEDTTLKEKRAFAAALKEMGVRHEYVETEGGHRWGVWRQYLGEFLPRLFR